MKLLKVIFVNTLLLLCFQSSFSQILKDAAKVEGLSSKGIDSAYHASVQISEYDTVRKRARQGVFSGVLVSAEGHILTVAHASKPNETYEISFPDGSKQLAVGLGRIAIKEPGKRKGLDLAMIKMLKPGTWHFAKMGSNMGMRLNQPTLSISFPGSFFNQTPNVRFGRLSNVDISSGYFLSTCKMEPGDSGGPLFDIQGRVIGLHSWIKNNEDENYEVPVDLYRKYWTALNVPKDYQELPEQDKIVDLSSLNADIPEVAAVQDLAVLNAKNSRSVVEIRSRRSGKSIRIFGALLEYEHSGKKVVYILSKSSELADSIMVLLDGKTFTASVLKRDKENDLALLQTSSPLKSPISLKAGTQMPPLSRSQLGNFLVTALPAGNKKVGVLSTMYIDMPLKFSVGNFGANAKFIDQKITITDIKKGSSSAEFLQLNDQVTAINGVAISKPAEYGTELSKYLAGDSLRVDGIRAGNPMHFTMYLSAYPGANHIASKFEGGRSSRSDGFKKVFVQDAAIKAEECGSPVFNAEGRFLGVNIARHSRTSTIVMPVEVIMEFLKQN